MNKQYKVIWSKVRHCYVVVSELAKRNGKTKSVKAQSCQKLAVTLTVLALSLGVTGVVGAANNTAGSGSGVAVGSGSSASNAASVAIGAGATANVSDGVALGSGSVANVALGFGYLPLYTSFEGNEYFSPAWRSSWGAVSVGVTDSSGVATKTRQIVGVAAGYQDTDAVNVAQLKKLDSKIEKHRVHYFAVSTTDTDNTDNVNALGTDSMAIGPSARANSERGLAIGKSAKVYSVDGVALGSNSYNIVTSNIRGYIPTSVTLTEEQQTTPTWRATMGAVAIGITAEDSTGAITTATGTRQIAGLAAGTQDTDAVNVAQLKAVNDKVDANKIKYVSIKQVSAGTADNENNDGATGDDATAIGVFASAMGANSTALGVKSQAAAANAIALGDFAAANGIGSVAAGDYAAAESHGAIAVGSEAKATGMQSIALGDEAKGTGYQATVVGGEATASGINSLAVGFGSNAKGQFGSAFGGAAAADGDFATAAGYGANAEANSATALGENSTASIEGGVALGSYSKTNVNSGVLGYDPRGKITTQEILLGDNKDTYDNLQAEITTAKSNVSSLAKQILDLQTEYDTADDTRRAEIVNEIKSLNTQFVTARADLQDKVSAANKLVSTWQATGAAVSVGDSDTGLTRQITNVAAGSEDTDAVNVAQLKQLNNKVDEGWNLAVGRGSASTSDYDATVEGDSAQIEPGGTVTLQAGRGIKLKQDGPAVEIGLKYLDVEPKGDTYNDAAASGEGALAIGQNSVASGQQGTALGFAAQATGKSSFAGGTNAIAGGGNSVAIGTNAITTVQESIAIGKGKGNDTDGYKKVDSGFSVAIGSSAVVGENSASSIAIGGSAEVTNSSGATALGSKAKVTESISGTAIGSSAAVSGSRNGTAIGKSAKVENAEDAVALGSQSVANRAKGTVGYDVTGTDHSNDAAGTWKSGLGAVSVGSQRSGNTRQIINVAAGSEDTDAVNVAQLKAVGSAGLNFKGDDGTTVVHRDLGATLNVVGGNTDADSLTDNNIGVVADDTTGTLNVKLAKNLTMGDGSVTFAPTGKDADGNALVQGQDGKWYSDLTDATYDATNNVYTKADGTTVSAVENPVVSSVKLTNEGLDNGGNKITNVAAGTVDTDIVNLGQLKGSTIGSSKVEYTDAGAGTITLTMQDGKEVKIGGLQDKYVTGASLDGNKLTITRNDNQKFEVDKIATTDDIVGENSKVNMKFTGDDTSEDGTITKINGATLNVLGGASEFTTANNIGVVKDGDALRVKLAKDVAMGNGSVTFANAKDGDGNSLVQGQDGKWYSDLTNATYDATNNVYTKADGTTIYAVENPTVSEVKLSNTGLDNGGNKITNVAAGTVDTDIVNLGQLKGSTIESSAVTYGADGSGTITLTMQDGKEVKIGGLQDKYIKDASLDGNKLTITRNDDKKFEVDNIATTADIIGENSKVNLKFTGDDTDEDAAITKKNGETLNILGGAKEFTAADNIGVVADTDKGTLNVKLAKNISMGDGSITFAPTGAKDAEGNALVQGKDGKWYSDLTDAIYDATNNVYTKSDGTTVSAVENPTVSEVKLSDTGLDNGGNKITNVAAGTEDTDIVNLGQLKGSTIGSSKVEYTDAGAGTVTLTMQDGKEVKINGLKDTYVSKAKFENNKLTFTRNDDTSFEVGDIASKSEMDTAVKDVNLKFTGDDTSDDATITKKNGETLTIYGGVAAKDADGNSLLTDVNNVGVVKTDDGLQIKLAKNLSGIDSARIGGTVADGAATGGIYIANQSVTYNGSSKKTENGLYITGLANTDWNPTTDGIVSGRAATEDQLKAAYDGLSTTITANKIVAGDNITVTPLEDGSGTKVSLSDNLAFGDKNGKNIAINGKDAIISAGDGKDNQVVVDGANSTVTAGTGANQVTVDGTKAGITAGEGANQVAIDGTKAAITAGEGKNQVAVDGTKGQVTIGETGKGLVMGNQEVAVKNADGTDKVDANGNPVKESGKFITGLDNTTWNPAEKGYVPDRAATEGQLKDISDSVKNVTDTIGVGKRDFVGDETADDKKVGVKLGESLNLKGGADVSKLSDGNIGVVTNKDKNGFDIKLSKDLKDLNSVTSNTVTTKELTVSEKANIGNVSISNDNVTIGTGDSKTVITNESVTTGSVTTGNTTINNDGLTVKNEDSSKNITVQNNNVSMGGNVVHNVGDGVEATDAINKGQFDRTVNAISTGMNQMSNRISKLDTRVDRVGAGAAALAALHPLEYNADEKWEISAGVGNYRGANAVAVGAFYRPNGNTLVSLGTSYGGGENMVNAGVTWRVGEGETGNYSSKQAMAQEISSLKSVVSDQSSQLQAQNSKIEAQSEQLSAQNDRLEAQNSKIEAQSQQLEEQNKKIEQLMQAIAALTK